MCRLACAPAFDLSEGIQQINGFDIRNRTEAELGEYVYLKSPHDLAGVEGGPFVEAGFVPLAGNGFKGVAVLAQGLPPVLLPEVGGVMAHGDLLPRLCAAFSGICQPDVGIDTQGEGLLFALEEVF